MAKLKMKNKKFASIVLPLSVLSLAVAIALPILGDVYKTTLNTALGMGKLHVVPTEGSENWDIDYVEQKHATAEEARNAGNTVSKSIADEGIVLLKNDNTLPLAKNSTVTPFGYSFINPIYGGTGSGNVDVSKDYVTTPEKGLKKNFTLNQTVVDVLKSAEVIKTSHAEGTSPAEGGSALGLGAIDHTLKDFDPAIYNGVKESCNGTTGVVFIGRGGGEGSDLKTDGYADGTKHKLDLSRRERETIKFAKANCAKVVAIINSSNVMELTDLISGELEVNSILWIGGPGAAGFESMSDIMVGDVNPSGRTVDIYEKDLRNNPAVKNFGDYAYSNATYDNGKGDVSAHFVQYEEGIYVGYKYYETASDLGYLTYGNEINYPFGYGLSYSSFEQKITSFQEKENEIHVSVEVTNTGSKAGKDTVQLYYGAPYTDYDAQNKIEKSTKNLVEFAKTPTIEPGKTATVDLKFAIEDMASYSYTRDNGDGTKGCYILEGGDYTIYLGKNSHDSYESKVYKQKNTIYYDNSNPRQSDKDGQSMLTDEGKPTDTPEKTQIDANAKFVAATNQFQECSDFMGEANVTNLSRSNFANTQPTSPVESDSTLPEKYNANLAAIRKNTFDVENNPVLGNVEGSKVYNNSEVKVNDNGYTLSSLRGKSYYDSEWDALLEQIDFDDATTQEQLRDLLYYGAYNTAELSSIGKVATKDFDGPQGISSFMVKGDWCAYCSEVVVASTWNVDLVRSYGEAIGQEGVTNNISGWYGPAMNIHRSPFAGRNFEYYSEDGVLAGKIATSVVSGAADQGFYAYLKHFALNDQETNRNAYICTWANEQAIRELYLKPFELATKHARGTLKYTADEKGTKATKIIRGTTAIMSSYNAIGTTISACNYNLLTNVLRNEWGFQGMVITDFGPITNYDAMIRSGNDYLLSANFRGTKPAFDQVFNDTKSNTSRNVMKNCIKNISYTVVNSLAYNKIAPGATSYRDAAPWQIGLACATAAFYVLTATGVGFTTYRFIDEKKNPGKYAK